MTSNIQRLLQAREKARGRPDTCGSLIGVLRVEAASSDIDGRRPSLAQEAQEALDDVLAGADLQNVVWGTASPPERHT